MSRPPTDRYGFPWQRFDPCPCGSTEVFEACCLAADGRPAMAIATLVPPEPKTGEAQANCYMAATCDCGGGLSREHYISRGLIDMDRNCGCAGCLGKTRKSPVILRTISSLGSSVDGIIRRCRHSMLMRSGSFSPSRQRSATRNGARFPAGPDISWPPDMRSNFGR